MTLIGNRPEWVLSDARVLPPRRRRAAVHRAAARQGPAPAHRRRAPAADRRRRAQPLPSCRRPASTPATALSSTSPTRRCSAPRPAAAVELAQADPCLITFTSGTAGEPKAVVHGAALPRRPAVQAEHWLGARPGELVWCTAASGWSKSARNVFIAPWLRGAAALLHDARFDPHERLELLERERVDVLCMAPTEYRVIAKRATLRALPALRGMVAAGEALNPEVLRAWEEATGLQIRDGYGQTETGQMTGMPLDAPRAARLDGQAAARRGAARARRRARRSTPRASPTFFLGYLEQCGAREQLASRTGARGPWHTGDRVSTRRGRLAVLRGAQRRRDHLRRLPDRPVRGRVRARRPPRRRRGRRGRRTRTRSAGSVVRAVVVLRDAAPQPSPELVRELQEHVKRETAPYKYPRDHRFRAPSCRRPRAERSGAAELGRPAARVRTPQSATIASISTCAPRGSAATRRSARARGGSCAKKRRRPR